jgi:cytochrome c
MKPWPWLPTSRPRALTKPIPRVSDPSGQFVDRDLYIVVYGMDGMVLAHGADAKRIGTNQIND